jgi:phage protein D
VSNLEVTKYRRGTGTNVSFPTLPSLSVQPRRIDLYQKQYTHDLLVLEFPTDSPLWFESVQTGVPVRFVWKQDTLEKNFIGYVSSITKTHSPQRMNSMTVLCVGSSFTLKERATRVFIKTSVPNAVRTIAEENGFNFIGEDHSQIFNQLSITGVSYWEWIQEQAKRIGYGIIVDGMNFFFRPIDKLIDMGFSSAAILSMGNTTAPFNTQYLDRTLDVFKVTNGDNIEDSINYRTIKNVGGVDPLTNKVILSSASPGNVGTGIRTEVKDVLFSEYRTDRVVTDDKSADLIAQGAAQMARFNLPATVKCQGDPRIRPFGTVFIAGTGDLTDGFWIVREAHHMFHKIGDYQLELKIATDGTGDTATTPFRNRTDINVGTLNFGETLTTNGIPALFFTFDSVQLKPEVKIIKEGNQGFNRTPNKWRRV